jgi:hypothetical protein
MKKYIIVIIVFIFLGIMIFCLLLNFNGKRKKNKDEFLNEINIEFCGRIINKEKKLRWGKEKIICCIDVAYSNVDSAYIYNTQYYIALKIKNKIATFVLPFTANNADSIAINIGNDRMERYYKDNILILESPIDFDSAYIAEDDLNICN